MLSHNSRYLLQTIQFAVFLLATLVTLRLGHLGIRTALQTCPERIREVHESHDDFISGATMRRFQGNKVRDFRGQKLQNSDFKTSLRTQNSTPLFPQPHFLHCSKWVVLTTIYEPSEAVRVVAVLLSDWCMVVVADTKTPQNYVKDADFNTERLVFLSVEEQQRLAAQNPFVAQIPYQSFARKNIGYLYAIQQNATIVLDLDDDNILTLSSDGNSSDSHVAESLEIFSGMAQRTMQVQTVDMPPKYSHRALNPFPLMGANISGTWPRGLPLHLVKNAEAMGLPGDIQVLPLSNFGVIQSVCNQDPDVDAVYRLTRPLPFSFLGNTSIAIPKGLYAPYNAQATLHFPSMYWGLYLPMTVTGRVSDIWRSYIVQRLMRDLAVSLDVIYSPALVTQVRNAHDYIGDMAAEQHLYVRTEAFLEFLDEWHSNKKTLWGRIQDLWIALYERQYVELNDVVGIQDWLRTLHLEGYTFPDV